MGTTSAILLLLLTLPRGASAEEVETLRLLDRCPREQRACVRMGVSTEDGKSLLTPHLVPDATGHAELPVRVRGSVDGDAPREWELRVRGFVSGIECTSFGQSTVAVVGLAPDGGATVLTGRGELRLETGALRIGCAACVAATELGRVRVTPAADLTLTGHRRDDLLETRGGDLAVRQGDGCVTLGERFSWRPSAECARLRSDRPLEIRSEACT